ncbi:TYRO protein tyrosine kinase-binding protein [Bufo gargarizans]|uniref:TYRO protein tyrosine kinase-binding protein n=1 Tax=Bufo gargarizans TaxID=30331 RepID=UPI001CF37407|nr:TYRO protein tyrosine kinase-binding protein [Bufo gargarizans]
MSWPVPALFLSLMMFGTAFAQEVAGCGNCFQLNTVTIIGIVICDAIITLVIAGMAFWISTKIQKKKYQERLRKLKTLSPVNESPYEELHGQRVEVYNDLNSFRT